MLKSTSHRIPTISDSDALMIDNQYSILVADPRRWVNSPYTAAKTCMQFVMYVRGTVSGYVG